MGVCLIVLISLIRRILTFLHGRYFTTQVSRLPCLRICSRRYRGARKARGRSFNRVRLKTLWLSFLLLHLCRAVASNMFHAAWVTQYGQVSSFDLESSFMQVQSSTRGPSELPREFAHLHGDMVKHHFLQWQRLNTHVWRGRGHQFRCAAEYLFEKASIASWYGWCHPSQEPKRFKGEAVTLITDIPRWHEKKDVILDIQTRFTTPGRPAQVQLSAGVLRIKRRLTRAYLAEQLRGQFAGELEYIFFNGRIWPEDSSTEIAVSHCDTFTILSRRELVPPSDDLLLRSTGDDTMACLDDEDVGRDHEQSRSGVQETREDQDSLPSLSDDSFSWQDFGLCTFMVGTPEGVRRYDALFRFDLPDETIFEMLSLFLRSDIDVEELLQSQGLAVDKQRIFIVIMEAPSGAQLSLQRRLRGYESETFKILRFRGKVTFDTYSAHFIEESPLEVHLGMSPWTTASYRNLHAGSLVTVMLPDPQGGAYSFLPSESSEPARVSLLQLAVSRSTTGTVVAQQASGNAEEATRDLRTAGTVHEKRQNCTSEIFDRLPPPGNPSPGDSSRPGPLDLYEILDDEGEEVRQVQNPERCTEDEPPDNLKNDGRCRSLHAEWISHDGTLDEAQFCPGSLDTAVVLDEDGSREGERAYTVGFPHDINDTLRLLIPWKHCPLTLELPSDFQAPPVALQFLYRCVAGWSERIQTIHIYTDGSSKSCDGESHAGFAFSVFGYDERRSPRHFFLGWMAKGVITDEHDPHFTGASEANAKEAETSALVWANIWILQSGIRKPVYFHYDALSVGNVMSGQWNSRPGWNQGNKLRELALFNGALRVGCEHHYEHCKAHSLQPCNELTDSLAKCAGHGAYDFQLDNIHWGPLFHADDDRLAWAWWNFTSIVGHEYPLISNNCMMIQAHSHQMLDGHVRPIEKPEATHRGQTDFWIRVGSYNTLTLHSKSDDGQLLSESTRARMLRGQLAQKGYHVVGLQETRCNLQTIFTSEDYHRFTSGSDPEKPGLWGCEIWIKKGAHVATTSKGDKLYIDVKRVTTLHAHPRMLVIHVKVGSSSIVFVSAHAPHEGATVDEKNMWWSLLHKLCSQYRHLGRWCILGDFNARLGDSAEGVIGNLLCDESDNDNGERLCALCREHGFWIPSTFEGVHVGTSYTWTHPKGSRQARIDYVLLDDHHWNNVQSFVDLDIITSNSAMDHELVGADLMWSWDFYQAENAGFAYDWEAMHTQEGRIKLQQVVDSLPVIDWSIDVHDHWQILEDALHTGLASTFPVQSKPQRSDIFSERTWTLREEKRAAKLNLVELDDAALDVYYWTAWQAWKQNVSIGTIRRQSIWLIAVVEASRSLILSHFRDKAKELRSSLARDKAGYIDKIVVSAGNCKGADIFRALRPLRIGSAIRKRGIKTLPYLVGADGVAAIDEEARDKMWTDHCAAMEAGHITTTADLLARTRKRTATLFGTCKETLKIEQVPTIVELESCFRRIKARKAAGVDGFRSDICAIAAPQLAKKYHPLLAKLFLRCEEPIQMKGGLIAAAHKSGSATVVSNYRSLLLSSHLGKALRRTVRQRLVPYYASASNSFHCSVKQGGCVSHASHGLRLAISGARSQGLSAGVLFLDVKAAYHRVVRELVVDMDDDGHSFSRLLEFFHMGDTSEAELLAAVSDESAAKALGIPDHLCHLLRETLSNTWFVTERKSTLVECLAGSRPGDGLADVVFAMIFRKILRCVQDDFQEQFGEQDYEACMDYDIFEGNVPKASVPSFLDIVWADDLAVIVTHKKASMMLERLTFVTSRVFFHCVRHGLAPNLRRGKTEVLLYLRGPGSRTLREQYFNVEEPYLEIPEAPPNLQKVAISASYKHLGSRIHLGKGLLPEIKARLGAAMAIFRKHRRTIFQNSLLTLDRRKYLFTTMILSIIRYNTGTWGTLSSGEMKYFTSRVMSMYRGLLRATLPDTTLRFWNNSMVLSEVGLASPLQLLTEARLSYVISVCKSGPSLLWSLAAAEKDWIYSVRENKEWLHAQLKGEGPDRFGTLWAPDYNKEIVDRPNVFKRWIRKASKHAILQHRLNCQWREWHHDFLLQLIDSGYSLAFPWPTGEQLEARATTDACLLCHRVFVSRAAWSVHAFKCHGRINDKRQLVHGSRCEVCMKEFTSEARLQRHLNYKTSCAVQLRRDGIFFEPPPGINSSSQRTTVDFPMPVLRTQGPHRQWQVPHAQEWDTGILDDVEEDLLNCALELPRGGDFLTEVEAFKNVLQRRWYSTRELFKTFKHFHGEMKLRWEDLREEENLPYSILEDILVWVEKHLHIRWFFTEQECEQLPGAEDLREAAWNFSCGKNAEEDGARWYTNMVVPRFGFRQLVFLHFFAGEQRCGDLQDALSRIQIPDGHTRVILSVDIIYDPVRADLSVRATQNRWIHFIKCGYITAFFAGPPCESWSRSRKSGGIPDVCQGDNGPRLLRLASRPQGLQSLRNRELSQLLLANSLLLFVIRAYLEMLLQGKFAMLEHPAEPAIEEERYLPSIWKLYVLQVLGKHPMSQLVTVFQGHFNACSPKPTSLLFGCGQNISATSILEKSRTQSVLPKALQMGRQNGEYATAALKNYPAAMCGALARVLEEWLRTSFDQNSADPISHDRDFNEFLGYVENLVQNFNFEAQQGADCAL